MTSGIAWEEQAYTPDETIIRMYQSPDRTEFVLSQPMSDPPGARFYYNGGNTYVLSALITKKAGRDALDFARDELFKPLSCSPFQVAGTRMRCSRASGSEWPRLSRAGGTIIKTTVDHALMRGLVTAGPVMRRGASSV